MRAGGSEPSTARLLLDFFSMDQVIWTTVRHLGLEMLKFTFITDQRLSSRGEKIQSP